MRQWEVWYVDQVKSRLQSDPQQPKDPSGKTRMYLIVCPQAHLDTKGWPVCVPIGTKSHSSLFHAELKAGEGGVAHDSFAWCNEIFTLDPGHFRTKMGEAPAHVQVDVKDALRDFFDFT